MSQNYYKIIGGKRYDREMIEIADEAVAGRGDGRISLEDARLLIAAVKDANSYTDIEKATMRHIRDNYRFTEAADKWFRTEIRKWAATKTPAAPSKKRGETRAGEAEPPQPALEEPQPKAPPASEPAPVIEPAQAAPAPPKVEAPVPASPAPPRPPVTPPSPPAPAPAAAPPQPAILRERPGEPERRKTRAYLLAGGMAVVAVILMMVVLSAPKSTVKQAITVETPTHISQIESSESAGEERAAEPETPPAVADAVPEEPPAVADAVPEEPVIEAAEDEKPTAEASTTQAAPSVTEDEAAAASRPPAIAAAAGQPTATAVIERAAAGSGRLAIPQENQGSRGSRGTPGGSHAVQRGETLWGIAGSWYRDALLWPNIYRVNRETIADPDLLPLHLNITVPSLEGRAPQLKAADQSAIAEGYLRIYQIYRKLGRGGPAAYLIEAKRRDPTIVERFKELLDE